MVGCAYGTYWGGAGLRLASSSVTDHALEGVAVVLVVALEATLAVAACVYMGCSGCPGHNAPVKNIDK